MSAFYISQLPVDQQRTLLVKDGISNVVWKFVAGLTKMKDVGWDVLPPPVPPATWWSRGEDIHDVVVEELFIQCLYEAEDVQCLERNFGLGVVKFINHQSISSYEAFALGYCISKTHDIVISKSPAFDFEYVMLGCGLKYVAGSGVVNRLTYSNDKNTEIHDNIHSPTHRIKSLEFSDYGLFRTDRTGFGNLAEYLPYLQNLISLRLAHNGLEPGVAILLKALRGHSKLESLLLKGMDTNVDDVNALMALVKSPHCCLKGLYISPTQYVRPDLPRESYQKLGRTLLSSRSSLETLYIDDFPPTVLDNVDDIAENISVLHLDLPLLRTHPKIHPSGIKYGTKLSQILRMNTSLNELRVDMTLDKNDVCDILHSLEHNHTLEKLVIREHNYVYQGYSLKSDLEDDSDFNSESELDSAQSKVTPCTPELLVQNDSLAIGPTMESASEPLPVANPSGVKGSTISNFLRRNTSLKELAFLFLSDRGELHDIVQSLGDNHTLEKLELPEEFKSEYSSMNIEDSRISWRDWP